VKYKNKLEMYWMVNFLTSGWHRKALDMKRTIRPEPEPDISNSVKPSQLQ